MPAYKSLQIWFILVGASILSTPAAALSLGSPQVHSVLGEPIDAVLPVEGSQSGATYTVRIAGEAEFRRLGLSVPSWVRNVTVTTEQGTDGRTYVRIGSQAPMREPLAYVVLELSWEGGRLLREITLLFDPPTLRRSAPLPIPPSPRRVASPGTDSRSKAATRSGGTTTRANDTLWALAERLRPAGVSQQHMMDALVRANPGAFVNGDPNRLRVGVALRVPSLPRGRNETAAVAGGHSTQPPVRAGTTTPPTELDDRPAAAKEGTVLRVVSPEESGAGEPLDELHAQLHIVRAEVATRRAQNQAMLDRVAELEQRSAALLRELERKEQTAAQLRAKANEPKAIQGPTAESPTTQSALVKTETPAPPPAPRIDAWRGWTLAAAAVILGVVTSAILLLINAGRARRRQGLEALDEQADQPKEGLRGGSRSNYSPSSFAETSATLAGVLTDDEAKAEPMVEVAFLKNFGRWEQAEALLRDLITQYPKRDDYRFELLDLYYRVQNSDAFKAFATALQPTLSRRAPGLWSEVARMGRRLDPTDALFQDGVGADGSTGELGEEPPKSANG